MSSPATGPSQQMTSATCSDPLARLTEQQMKTLRSWLRGNKVEHRLKVRAKIVWGLFQEGKPVRKVAAEVGVVERTVRKWRARFCQEGLDGLYDRPRSGAPPRFRVGQRCEVLAIACDDPAHDGFFQTRWTCDALIEAVNRAIPGLNMSRSSVWRTLTENKLKPHKLRMWLHSPDPNFREKVNAIVELYLHPPRDAVVLCVDEKTGIQAKERKHETRRPVPGRPGRYEHEYIRHGTQSLLAALNIANGRVTAQCRDRRGAADLEALMDQVAREYREARRIIVIWDNLNIHLDGPGERWSRFNARHGGKFKFVYTPLHASWVNQIELFFSILQRRCLRYGSFTSVEDLRSKLLGFVERWNRVDGHPFAWSFRGYPMQEKAVA